VITTTLRSILNLKDSLTKLGQSDLPIKLSYRISRLVLLINNELKLFDENRSSILDKYKDSSNNISPERIPEFNQAMDELLNIEVRLDCDQIELNEINTSKLSLTAFDIINLSEFIKFEVDGLN